ncbi:MAG: phosphate acyltransferase [Gemmatimonadota bacterium]
MAAVHTFEDLRRRAAAGSPVPVALVEADSPTGLRALAAAADAGIAEPVLVGDGSLVRAAIRREGLDELLRARLEHVDGAGDEDAFRVATARRAVALARSGEVAVLLKGWLRTDQLLRAALDRETGLGTGRLLSDVLLYEDTLAGETRLVGITDGGINPAPDPAALIQIVGNAVDVFRALGFERPRVALLSATEAVSEAVASTVAARAVAEWAASELPAADVDGPLALDNALLESAAREKGIGGPVAGRADIMVAPSIEAGNILGKGVKYLGGSITAHVVVGAAVPILIPSRVESAVDKLHSIALGVLLARERSSAAAH